MQRVSYEPQTEESVEPNPDPNSGVSPEGSTTSFARVKNILKFIPGAAALTLGTLFTIPETIKVRQDRVNQTGVDRSLRDLPADIFEGIGNIGKSYDDREKARGEALEAEHFKKLSADIQFHTERLVYVRELFNTEVRGKVDPPCSLEEQERLTRDLKDAVADLGRDIMNAAANEYPNNPKVLEVIGSSGLGIEELIKMSKEDLPPMVLDEVKGYVDLLPGKLAARKAAYQNDAGNNVTSL